MTIPLAIPPETATLALAGPHIAVNTAVGLIVAVLGWAAHHKLAHRHRILDFFAKAMLVAGSTILLAAAGSRVLPTVNNWTGTGLANFMSWAGISTTWPHSIGLLTLVELPLVVWAFAHVWDLLRGGRGSGGRVGGSVGARQWGTLESHFDRYGLILVGPMASTLPGVFGYICALPFAALAALVGKLFGAWLGM